ILPFLGTAVLGLQPIIVSKFMANGNMLEYIGRADSKQVPRSELVAEAVTFLHKDAGLVHGDLKCENVLISDDGRALLADFGLSALIDKIESSVTTSPVVRGWNTVRFASPELLADTATSGSPARVRSKTTQSDVWAFAMLMIQVA
ncbi:kinase-like protein, partial [Auricularia subglabra TFB-10046 SS5]